MSVITSEPNSAIASAAGRLKALVEPDLGSIQDAVAARVTQLPMRDERIQVDLGGVRSLSSTWRLGR